MTEIPVPPPEAAAHLATRAWQTSRLGTVRSVGQVRVDDRVLFAVGGSGDLGAGGGVELFELAGNRLVSHGEPVPSRVGEVGSTDWVRVGDRLLLATGASGGLGGGVELFELVGDDLVPRGEPVASRVGGVQSLASAQVGDRLLLAAGGINLLDLSSSGGRAGGGVELFELLGDGLVARGKPVASRVGGVQSLEWVQVGGRLLLATGGSNFVGIGGGVELFELVDDRLAPSSEPAPTYLASVRSVACAVAYDRLLLAAGGDDIAGAGGIELFEVADGGPVPASESVISQAYTVESMAWVRVGTRLFLATGAHDVITGGGSVELTEFIGGGLVPYAEPATSLVGAVWSLGWVRDGDRLLLATGGNSSAGGGVELFELGEERVSANLPGYRSDAAEGTDELARTSDAQALAELLTAVSARPPLAVGLFGQWGQGKSHFMELLRAQVQATARRGNPLAAHDVRQVRFNAWHYAETGLWPSLVAELFAQLAAPADGADPGQAQRSLSALSARLVTERQLPERLHAARLRLEKLTDAVHRLQNSAWEGMPPADRIPLIEQAGSEKAARLYTEATESTAVLRETLLRLRATVALLGWRWVAGFLMACAAGAAVVLVWPQLPRWAAAVPFLASIPSAASAVYRRMAKMHTYLESVRGKLREVVDRQRLDIETAARLAAEEVAALQRQMQDLTAAGQLAGLVEERAGVADYRSQLGVMTRIRQDFERMASLLNEASQQRALSNGDGPADGGGDAWKDAADDTLPAIDRIVLYIDDLDRCPPQRVVEMLEAIHLLLALDLFVVVVAIDPQWLLAAIAAHYRDILKSAPFDDKDESGYAPSDPAQYLEKIFQVVFTLPPLQEAGYRRLMRSMLAVHDASAPPRGAPPTRRNLPPTPEPPHRAGERSRTASEHHEQDGPLHPVPHASRIGIVERTDLLTLEAEELQLLDLLGPPLMVATPRAVKRLANSYGLLTALRRDHRDSDLAEHPQSDTDTSGSDTTYYRPYRAGMVLLAALVAYPAAGPALCLRLHQAALDDPLAGWLEFCQHLARPVQHPDLPAAAPEHSHLRQLSHALLFTTDQAQQHDLPLPHALQAWQQWIIPVARLSFPAGQVIASLYRQQRRSPQDSGRQRGESTTA